MGAAAFVRFLHQIVEDKIRKRKDLRIWQLKF